MFFKQTKSSSVSTRASDRNKSMKLGRYTIGMQCRLHSFWVGVHYSPYNLRYCVNLVPFITIWLVLPGGCVPHPLPH